jgi:hypothetical protein
VPSSSTFPNLFDQSDAYRIKEPEIYDNYNGDIAESYTNSLRRLMGHEGSIDYSKYWPFNCYQKIDKNLIYV